MKQSPSGEAESGSDINKISRLLRNQKVHYRVRVILPPVPILSQINPIHNPLLMQLP
jgi:hypothetical protein